MDTLLTLLDNPVLNTLSLTLVHFTWQGLAIASVLYLLLKGISDKHSILRYNLALFAMLLNFLVPALTFVYLYQQGAGLASEFADSGFIDSSIAAVSASTAAEHSWLPLLSIAWMSGVLYLSIFLLKEVFYTYQLPRVQTQEAPQHLQVIFEQLLTTLKIKQPARLLLSLKAEVPMVVGWLKPVVLLPVNLITGLNNDQLTMLLAHELAHVRRYDYLVNFLQSLVELLLFFHPCVKWVSKQVRAEREYCCDDVAVNHCGCPLAYANTLTEAELLRPHHIPHLAMAASGGDLKKRVFRVVGQTTCSPSYSGQWLAAISGIVLVSGLLTVHDVTSMTHSTESIEVIQSVEEQLIPSTQPVPEQLQAAEKVTETAIPVAQPANKTEIIAEPVATAKAIVIEKISKNSASPSEMEVKAESAAVQQQEKHIEQKDIVEKSEPQQPELVQTKQLNPATVEVSATVEVKTTPKTEIQNNSIQEEQQQTKAVEAAIALESEQAPQQAPEQLINIKQQAAEVVKLDIAQPRAIKTVAPYYPIKAKRRKLVGDVSVSFTVELNGRVSNIVFAEGTHRLFQKEVKKALKAWRFKPGKKDGKPAALRIKRVFSFTNPDETPTPLTGSRIA